MKAVTLSYFVECILVQPVIMCLCQKDFITSVMGYCFALSSYQTIIPTVYYYLMVLCGKFQTNLQNRPMSHTSNHM